MYVQMYVTTFDTFSMLCVEEASDDEEALVKKGDKETYADEPAEEEEPKPKKKKKEDGEKPKAKAKSKEKAKAKAHVKTHAKDTAASVGEEVGKPPTSDEAAAAAEAAPPAASNEGGTAVRDRIKAAKFREWLWDVLPAATREAWEATHVCS
jgi:outer membrane biosynthesis protein TonB